MQKSLLRDIYQSMARTDFAMLSNGLKDGKMGWSLFLALYSEKYGNNRVRPNVPCPSLFHNVKPPVLEIDYTTSSLDSSRFGIDASYRAT